MCDCMHVLLLSYPVKSLNNELSALDKDLLCAKSCFRSDYVFTANCEPL